MPIQYSHGYAMITLNFDFRHKYWSNLSEEVKQNFNENIEITDPISIESTLKTCFTSLCNKFSELIENEKRASFYLFVHNFHENSCELYHKQLKKEPIDIDGSDFAATRRGLKIILEQSTNNILTNSSNFEKEIVDNWNQYVSYTEELLYLFYQANSISEYIAINKLFVNSIKLELDENLLLIIHNEPHQSLTNVLVETMKEHNDNVVLQPHAIKILQDFLQKELNIDYSEVISFVYALSENSMSRFGFVDLEEIKSNLCHDSSNLNDFFSGLTVSKENVLSVPDCILKNQDEKRYTYRPILQYQIDNKTWHLIGKNKFDESIVLLTTNAMPFGIAPNEWRKTKPQRKFFSCLDNIHDKILEEPIWKILDDRSIIYDKNIESVCPVKGNCINIKKIEGVGEIDIILIKEDEKKVYVIDCKHNRSRFDVNNWKRDYDQFKKVYEMKLEGKRKWVEDNLQLVGEHLNCINRSNLKIESYEVDAFFVINTPTIYMFNGRFRVLTIYDFEKFIDNDFVDIIIRLKNSDTGEIHDVTYPYFDNLVS